MKTTGKIGFHFGSESTATGYGEYIRELDAAGIPATVMSIASEGFGDIEVVWDSGSTVPHVAVIRCMSHNDVPRYDLPIDDAVTDWLDRYCPTIGADVIKYHDRVITKHGNELDRNKIVWLADFYIALHPRLLERMGWESHQICIFNFAGGNPDPDQWELILPQLKIFGDNPDKFIIGCHEYSFDDKNIWNKDIGGNLLIGRFKYLFDTCDANNIKRPLYAIHEWGWRDTKIPDLIGQAMSDIDAVNELYCMYPEIIGAGIWTLQEWQGWKGLEVWELIKPVKELTLNKLYDVLEQPPMGKDKIVIAKKPQIHNMTQAENQQVSDWAFETFGRTTTHAPSDMFSMLASGNSESYAVVWWPTRQPEVIQMLENAGYDYILMPDTPPPNEFHFTHWPVAGVKTSINQAFGANPQNYEKFGLPGHDGIDIYAPHGTPIVAVQTGTVYRVESTDNGNYGLQVRIDHGEGHKTVYAHLNNVDVTVGQHVTGGQKLGNADNTGNSFGSHLHHTYKREGLTYVDENGNAWPWNIHDQTDLLTPLMITPPIDPPPIGESRDLLPYLKGDGRLYEVRNGWGGQERFQTQTPEPGTFDQTKNSLAERLYFDSTLIYRGIDISPGGNRFYIQQEPKGTDRARWMPRHMAIGQSFTVSLWVQFYNGDCGLVNEKPTGAVTDTRTLREHYETWTSRAGITVKDVIRITWDNGGETYFYARGLGLVGWERSHQDPNTPEWSAISEIHEAGQRPDNVVMWPNC